MAGVCTGSGPCDVHPTGHGGDNFVTRGGGFDPYLRAIINALKRKGHPESQAVQIAIGTVQRWARGEGNVSAATRARAAKSLAHWEALRAKAHAMTAAPASTLDLAEPGQRYKHGWIKLTGADLTMHKRTDAVLARHSLAGSQDALDASAQGDHFAAARRLTSLADAHKLPKGHDVRRLADLHARLGSSQKRKRQDLADLKELVYNPHTGRVGLTANSAATVDLAFTEALHPRGQKGTSQGGRFVAKGSSTTASGSSKQVRDFQRRTGMKQTGVIDKATAAKIRALMNPKSGGSSGGGAKTGGKAKTTAKQSASATASAVNSLPPVRRAQFRILRSAPPLGYKWTADNRLVRVTAQSRMVRRILAGK